MRSLCREPLTEAMEAIAERFERDKYELQTLLSRTAFRHHCASERDLMPLDEPKPFSPWWRRWKFRE